MGFLAKYILIKGDIIKSKSFDNFPEIFSKRVKELNYPESVINKFKILKGDEIQGVFTAELDIIKFLRYLRLSLLPLKIRLVISTVEKEGKNNLENNKQLFKKVDSKLDYIGQNRHYKSYFISADDFTEKSINTIMLLIDKLRFSWDKNEWNLYFDYADHQNFELMAEKYNYEGDRLSKLAQNLGFEEILFSELNLEQILKSKFY